MPTPTKSPKPIRSILVAIRSEISIRVMRAVAKMGIRTVAIYSTEDRHALHAGMRFLADESGTRQNRNLQGTRARTRKRP